MKLDGVGVLLVLATVAGGAACKKHASTASGAGSTQGSAHESAAEGTKQTSAVKTGIAALPGELWFVEEVDAHQKLIRIAKGKRLEIADRLTPSSSRLPDGRLVAVRELTAGSPSTKQLALIASDGTVTSIGPTSTQMHDPIVGPEGTWIMVAMFVGPDHEEVVRIDVATEKTTQITNNPEGNTSPVNLGGDAIVFVSFRDHDSQLYLGSASGGPESPLLTSHNWDGAPAPSPDRGMLAFTSAREGATKLFVVDVNAMQPRRLTEGLEREGDEGNAVWAPDGARIAYVNTLRGVSQVWIREIATGKERLATPAGMDDRHPVWSPDGAWLMVARSTAGTPLVGDLWALPTAGGDPLQITRTPDIEFDPRWL